MTTHDKALGQMRREAILDALYADYPAPMGDGLLLETVPEHLQPTPRSLARAVDYLTGRDHIETTKRGRVHVCRLTPAGIDHIEGRDDFSRAERARLRMLRLRVLQSLDWSRPSPASIPLIQRALKADDDLDLTTPAVQRALAYLQGCQFVELQHDGQMACIRPDGIDYLGGDGQDRPGIARPLEY